MNQNKETSISRVRDFVLSHKEFTNVEIDNYMQFHKGQLSWRTRISDVRKELEAKGGGLDCIPIDVKNGLYKYIVKESIPLKVEENGQLAMAI